MIKWNQKVKDIVAQNDRMNDFYNTGMVQKASVEDFVEDIVTMCAQVANDAGLSRIPASEYPNLIMEEFGFSKSKK